MHARKLVYRRGYSPPRAFRASTQKVLPISRDPTGRPGGRLIEGMMLRRCEARSLHEVVGLVAPEPILTRLETANDGMIS
jgi:hypothetical protein